MSHSAAAKIGAPYKEYKLLSGRYQRTGVRQGESAKTTFTSLYFWRAPPLALRCGPNVKPAPWVEAPGQAKRPQSQKDSVCFRWLSMQCPGGSSQPRMVSPIVLVPWDPESQGPQASRARRSMGMSMGGMLVHRGKNRGNRRG